MIFIIISIGIIYAGLLYYNNPLNKLGKVTSIILSVFRFIIVTFLLFLLLSPYIRTKNKIIEKPVVILGIDNSESIKHTSDSTYYKAGFIGDIKNVLSPLEDKSDVDIYKFGESVSDFDSLNLTDAVSDYSKFIRYINENYSGQNVGAVIIAGDGIYNSGTDPVAAISNLNWPIFTVAMGDTSGVTDIKIADVRNNAIVYTNDHFPVEVSIIASGLPVGSIGERVVVKLYENNQEISRKSIDVTAENFSSTVNFIVKATDPGKRRMRIVVDAMDSETLLENNSRDIFIDVLDTRIKILLLADAPHPDIGAISKSLSRNPNFEVKVQYGSDFRGDVSEYNVAVLYQIPTVNYSTSWVITQIIEAELPMVFFIGNNTNLGHFNRLQTGLRILPTGTSDIAFARFNNNFSRFIFSESDANQLGSLPPLITPLGNYILSEATDVFAWQEISDILTDSPMITYYSDITRRNSVIVGEGIWLWRMQSKLKFNNTDAIDALLSKTIMYLSADNDKRRFKVISEGKFDFRKDVILRAEYYNEAMEADNRKEIELRISDEDGNIYRYSFVPFENSYILNLKRLPVGVYTYIAVVEDDSELIERGDFIVEKIELESSNVIADHAMLRRLSQTSSGNMYYSSDLAQLPIDIENQQILKSKVHFQDSFIGLNAMIISLLLLLLLVSVEWFLRKYFGNY